MEFTRLCHSQKVFAAALLAATMMITPALAQETTITFLTPPWGVPPDEAALTAFEEESGINVEVQSVQIADLFSRVQVAAASGQPAADVIFLTEEAPSNIVATGNLLPLNDLIASTPDLDLSDFNPVDFWTTDDQVYGIPTYQQLVMMDYNAARLAEAGFDAPPTTWDEFTEQARAIKEQGVDDYPIAFGAIDWSWYLMSLSMGDPMFDADLNPVFADEGSQARRAMNLLLSYFSDELISPEIVAGSITQHNLFWSGTGVFHQGWQGSVAVGNGENSEQAPNVEYLPLPEAGNTWSFPAALGIAADSPNADAAWQFIQWYVSPENQEAIYGAFGLYPSRTSVAETLNEEGAIAGFEEIIGQSERVTELPRYTLWWGPFTDIVSESILQAAQTGMSGDEVVDMLAEEWNNLRAEYE